MAGKNTSARRITIFAEQPDSWVVIVRKMNGVGGYTVEVDKGKIVRSQMLAATADQQVALVVEEYDDGVVVLRETGTDRIQPMNMDMPQAWTENIEDLLDELDPYEGGTHIYVDVQIDENGFLRVANPSSLARGDKFRFTGWWGTKDNCWSLSTGS